MTSALKTKEPLYSTLAGDPDLGEIVEMFVDEMPDRISALLEKLDSADWEELQRTAHQLKGAAGSYGFDRISPQAAIVENAVRENAPEQELCHEVNALVDLCRRATADTPR